MASRIIHLAITNELTKKYAFKNPARLYFGTIVPDAASNRQEYLQTHFKMAIGEKTERSYNLTEFREMFAEEMKNDDLYLGYYLHLIQDLLYRHFVYDKYHWDPRPEGNLARLYDDYRQINQYLIKKYEMVNDVVLPASFEQERISKIAEFDTERFLEEYKQDFQPVAYKERFFFTDDMVDEYIQWAVDYCKKELDALREGSHYFDEYEWSWGK